MSINATTNYPAASTIIKVPMHGPSDHDDLTSREARARGSNSDIPPAQTTPQEWREVEVSLTTLPVRSGIGGLPVTGETHAIASSLGLTPGLIGR
jgi:hypothetical protein